MICCDTCEEWYHGKCVNITKAMGQQMEAEGKEWICLFCKVSDRTIRVGQNDHKIRKCLRIKYKKGRITYLLHLPNVEDVQKIFWAATDCASYMSCAINLSSNLNNVK